MTRCEYNHKHSMCIKSHIEKKNIKIIKICKESQNLPCYVTNMKFKLFQKSLQVWFKAWKVQWIRKNDINATAVRIGETGIYQTLLSIHPVMAPHCGKSELVLSEVAFIIEFLMEALASGMLVTASIHLMASMKHSMPFRSGITILLAQHTPFLLNASPSPSQYLV